MTARLYYTEPYRTTFEARVLSCDEVAGRLHVVLDRTAFYPTSGGQPFDTGTLGGAAVFEVIERGDGAVVHVVSSPLEAGTAVTGAIDWPRRFDHMQQHSGQHVLSAAFDRLVGAGTESVHLGAEVSTIDLGREVTPAELARAEEEANRLVWEDRPVSIRFVSADEAARLPLRKEPARGGTLRLIEIEGVDVSACGGTHVSRTGAIGAVAITNWEKFRGGTRVEFLCGGRVLARFRAWRDALAAVQRHLSVAPAEMAAGIERLQAEAKSLERRLRGLQERLAAVEAPALVARAERTGGRPLVVEALEGWDAPALKALATAVAAAEPAAAVVLFTTTVPALVVVARGGTCELDARAVVNSLTARFGGKGGGKPDLAQGGGLQGAAAELVGAARDLLRP